MTSPVGHMLGGYIAAGRYCKRASILSSLMVLIFAANAPDLDFLYGAIRGDFNGLHHGASHSIGAVIMFVALVYAFCKALNKQAGQLSAIAGLAYSSHLALDLVTVDTTAPHGMKLFWPINEHYILAPQTLFQNIEHGAMGDSLLAALSSIFSMHNLVSVGAEILVLGPLALFLYWRRLKFPANHFQAK